MNNVIPFFERVEFMTIQFWRHTARDIVVPVSELHNRELKISLYEYFDKVECVRCFLGMKAEWLEHEEDPGLDEFADIIFYTARVANYFEINRVVYDATPMSRSFKFLEAMTQPMRNLLRPDEMKPKHHKILKDNLNRFIGACYAHMKFAGYTEDEIMNQLMTKLSARYK